MTSNSRTTTTIAICALIAAQPSVLHAQEPLRDLLVSSRNTSSVKRFDGRTGEYVDDFIARGSGGLSQTQEILLAPDGDLIVSGLGNADVLRFDSRTGAYKGPFTSGYRLELPTKMTWGPDGNLYVSQWGATRDVVAVFGPDGSYVREATPRLNDPMQHAWDEDGSLLVVYWGSKDVRRFDAAGNQVEIFISDSRLTGPVNLRWDADHDLQVFDWQSGGVYRYDGDTGEYLGTFIASVRSPEGWAIGPDGHLYVAEWNGNAVKRFDTSTGVLIDTFVSGGGLNAPNSVLFVERPSVFELAAPVREVDVGFGSSTTVTVEVSGSRGVPFELPVQLACTSGNTAVECSVSPASVTPGAGVAQATVTITASPRAAGLPVSVAVSALLCVAALAILVRREDGHWGSGLIVLGLALFVSCGGGPTDSDGAGFDTSIQLSGTSDGLTSSVTIDVSVRP